MCGCCALVQYICTTLATVGMFPRVCADDEPPILQPSRRSSEDTARYCGGYQACDHHVRSCDHHVTPQSKRDDPRLRDNYLFYTNAIPYKPGGIKIDKFHRTMWGQYQELERNHSYIQWSVIHHTREYHGLPQAQFPRNIFLIPRVKARAWSKARFSLCPWGN